MIQVVLSRIGWFLLLLLLQVLVFNHIHILGYATPMPYVYFLLILPKETPRWLPIAAAFVLGLVIDLFSNTPGMTAASLCLCGLISPWLQSAMTPADDDTENALPSARRMTWGMFLLYAFIVTLLNTGVYYLIEAFSVSRWKELLINIGAGTVLTMIFIIVFESLRTHGKK